MKFEAYVRRLNFAALFRFRPSRKRHASRSDIMYDWIVQDRGITRRGGELLPTVIVSRGGTYNGGRI